MATPHVQPNASGYLRPRVARIVGKGRSGCARLVWGGGFPVQVGSAMSPTPSYQDNHIDDDKNHSRIHQMSLPGRTHSRTGDCAVGKLFPRRCWMLVWQGTGWILNIIDVWISELGMLVRRWTYREPQSRSKRAWTMCFLMVQVCRRKGPNENISSE